MSTNWKKKKKNLYIPLLGLAVLGMTSGCIKPKSEAYQMFGAGMLHSKDQTYENEEIKELSSVRGATVKYGITGIKSPDDKIPFLSFYLAGIGGAGYPNLFEDSHSDQTSSVFSNLSFGTCFFASSIVDLCVDILTGAYSRIESEDRRSVFLTASLLGSPIFPGFNKVMALGITMPFRLFSDRHRIQFHGTQFQGSDRVGLMHEQWTWQYVYLLPIK